MQIDNITKDDYFAKNAEFTAWLRDEKGKLFNDMDADETRAFFGKHDCQTQCLHKPDVFVLLCTRPFSILVVEVCTQIDTWQWN